MPRLSSARDGEPLVVKKRALPFSYWPMRQSAPRYSLQSCIFSSNPWHLLARRVKERCPQHARKAAIAFLEQSSDYYRAASDARITAAKPLLLYYGVLNLAKAHILTIGKRKNLDQAKHGLSEQGGAIPKAYLQAYPSRANEINIFDEFLRAANGQGLPKTKTKTRFKMSRLLPQIVTGHQLWTAATGRKERFVALHRIEFYEQRASKEIWLRFFVLADKLSRIDVSHKNFLRRAGLENEWQQVGCDESTEDGRRVLCFEQIETIRYGHRACDKVLELVRTFRPKLWAVVLLQPPYRHYYLYLAPASNRRSVLPQLLAIYAITYYLGSITRYRPHEFDQLAAGKYGPMIEAFLSENPVQFIYLVASDLMQQEVTRPSTVSGILT